MERGGTVLFGNKQSRMTPHDPDSPGGAILGFLAIQQVLSRVSPSDLEALPEIAPADDKSTSTS
jgi:hypothetical protein